MTSNFKDIPQNYLDIAQDKSLKDIKHLNALSSLEKSQMILRTILENNLRKAAVNYLRTTLKDVKAENKQLLEALQDLLSEAKGEKFDGTWQETMIQAKEAIEKSI